MAEEQVAADLPDSNWKPEEVGLLEAVVDQLGIAPDSARLFEQTQQQAERERIVGEVTSRIRSSLDVQTILQTAVREMRDALNLQDVEIRIGSGKEGTENRSRDASNQQNDNIGGG